MQPLLSHTHTNICLIFVKYTRLCVLSLRYDNLNMEFKKWKKIVDKRQRALHVDMAIIS